MKRFALPCLLAAWPSGCDDGDTPRDTTATDATDTDHVDPTETEGGTGLDEIDCDQQPVITYDTFGRGFLASYCNGCHGGQVVDRKGAPPTVVFDDRTQVSAQAHRIYARIMQLDESLSPMPPAGGIPPDDLARAQIWLTCYP